MFTGLDGLSVFVLVTALASAVVVCVCARPLGDRLKVMAYPDALRRRHSLATPQVGGIAILLALIVWLCGLLLTGQIIDRPLVISILLCGAGVGLVGFADDQSHTTPIVRLLSLVVFVGVALAVEPEFFFHTLNWGSFDPTIIPNWVCVGLVGIAAVGLVNAVNMADGQNGVAGGMYVVWTLCLVFASNGTSAAIAGLLLGASLVFLAFNFRGKLFLGDCGSYGVTFVIGLLTLLAHARGQVSLETVMAWYFIPVMDCLRLLSSRPLRGRSPFDGDRDHFHHRLEDKMGKTFGLASYAAAVSISSLLSTLEPRFTLVCLAALCAFYFSFAWLTDSATALLQNAAPQPDSTDAANGKVISLSGETRNELRRNEAG